MLPRRRNGSRPISRDAERLLDLLNTLGGTTFRQLLWQKASPLSEGTRTWTELVGLSAVSTSIAYVGSMIMQGLFDKYPTLRVIIKEGGFWWLPEQGEDKEEEQDD